jgi:hypothetical protein
MLDLGIQHLIVVGGEAALHNEAIPDKASTGADYERIAGNDRYETATKLADFSLLKVPGWSTSLVDLSTGSSSADALADGAAAGKSSRSILLTASTTLSTATRTWLSAHNKTLATGRVLGGTGAVSDAVKTAAEQAGRGA